MRYRWLAALAASCSWNGAHAERPATISVEVPAYTRIKIEGVSLSEPEVPLSFEVPVGPDGRYLVPRTPEEMITSIRDGLPPEFLKGLLYDLGFEDEDGSNVTIEYDSRLGHLYGFLFDIWDLNNTDTKLGRFIRCVVWGENELTPIMYSVARLELSQGDYRQRDDVPQGLYLHAPLSIAGRLVSVCSRDEE